MCKINENHVNNRIIFIKLKCILTTKKVATLNRHSPIKTSHSEFYNYTEINLIAFPSPVNAYILSLFLTMFALTRCFTMHNATEDFMGFFVGFTFFYGTVSMG